MDEKLVYEDLDKESNECLKQFFTTPFRTGYIKCKGCFVTKYFKDFGDKIKKMDIRDDDIWVCTFPKTGTTWTQEMVWCIANDLDFEAAKKEMDFRFPFLEISIIIDHKKVMIDIPEISFPDYLLDSVEHINKLPSPRFIKSHLPFNLLPEKLQNNATSAKIIYVSRNPRDTCISYYHHCRSGEGFKGSFELFADLFLKGHVLFAPFFDHIKGFWTQRNRSNILFLKYEDMKMDLESVIHKTADFIGKRVPEDGLKKLLDHLSFSSMKQNKALNNEKEDEFFSKCNLLAGDTNTPFIRRGIVGEWKEVFDASLCERFEKWEEKNLKEIDNFTF